MNTYGREHIRQGLFQDLAAELSDHSDMQPLSKAERLESLKALLDKRPPSAKHIWVFAYGSLIWNPGFYFTQRQRIHVFGYHRQFCLKAFVGRGSLENPGLLLGLTSGGSCPGIGYQIAEEKLEDELSILWDREMMGGSYRPSWLSGFTQDKQRLDMISFVIRKDTNRYFASRDIEIVSNHIAKAEGSLGLCRDYVFNTQKALEEEGISDHRLAQIANKLRQYP